MQGNVSVSESAHRNRQIQHPISVDQALPYVLVFNRNPPLTNPTYP